MHIFARRLCTVGLGVAVVASVRAYVTPVRAYAASAPSDVPAASATIPANADAGAANVAAAQALRLLPRPRSVAFATSCRAQSPETLLAALQRDGDADPGGVDLVAERWRALGIVPAPSSNRASSGLSIRVADAGTNSSTGPSTSATTPTSEMPSTITSPSPSPSPSDAEYYELVVDERRVSIVGRTPEADFDALATLAQLPVRDGKRWRVPCVRVADSPALRWRILSDDVSRGPLPTMRYFKERIRTLAGFKMNGYSPYMEHVFVDPHHPLPAPLDGITPQQLAELDAYARHFHVAFVPEQQTFAHMHETLKYERYAPLAELPHGYLLSPAAAESAAYAHDLISDELAAVPHPPFFHIGSDEPSDLGRGLAKSLVQARGEGPVFAQHVVDVANDVIALGGGRPMIWDDALARHPELFALLPKELVFVNWHYGTEKTYRPYIERIAKGGFEQMVAPGALNWNELYPDLDAALGNIDRFVTEGKAAHVLGLFQTVWHDDGETLFEATWYPVVYAAASAWQEVSVDRERYARDFAAMFFGSDDGRYADDFAELAACRRLLHGNPREYGDYLFWTDPFEPSLQRAVATADAAAGPHWSDFAALRGHAERVMEHLRLAPPPPLHANAAAVMALGARRYDLLGRNFQIAREARSYYDDARANADGKHDGFVYRGLFVTKYLFWEQRDALLALEPQVRAAWEYENRQSHESSVLERYHLAAARSIERADRISETVYRDYVAKKKLPSFDDALGLTAR